MKKEEEHSKTGKKARWMEMERCKCKNKAKDRRRPSTNGEVAQACRAMPPLTLSLHSLISAISATTL